MAHSPNQISISVEPIGGPISTFFGGDLEPPEAAQFFELVGRFFAIWSRIELGVTMLVNPFHQPDTLPDGLKKYPISFDRKLLLIDYYFDKYDDFSNYRERYAEVKKAIKALSEDRHNLTHMMYSGFVKNKGELCISLQSFHKENSQKKRYYSIKKMEEILTRGGHIALFFLILVSDVQHSLLSRPRESVD